MASSVPPGGMDDATPPKGMGPGGGVVGMGLKLPAATSHQAYLGVCVCVYCQALNC